MTVQGAVAPAVDRPATKGISGWWVARVVLLVAAVVVVPCVWMTGTHSLSYSSLTDGLASGSISHVTVAGEMPSHAQGSGTVTIGWRENGHRAQAEVQQVSGAGQSSNGHAPVIIGSVDAALRAAAHGHNLRIDQDRLPTTTWSLAQWTVPMWVALSGMAVWFVTLMLITGGPEPRYASRWACGWLMLSPLVVLVVPAFLIFSGPQRPTDAPSGRQGKRLTGGWAFLIGFVVMGSMSVWP